MLFDIALKILTRRKLRSLLTIFGVAMAVQLYLMIDGITSFYDADIQKQISVFAGKVYIQQPLLGTDTIEDFPSMSSNVDQEKADTILSWEGVNREASSAILFVPLVPDVRPNMPPTSFVVGIEPGRETAFLGEVEALDGILRITQSHDVILGKGASKNLNTADGHSPVQAGDTLRVYEEDFNVVGIVDSNSTLYSGAILMPLTTAQDLFNRPEIVSAVIVTTLSLDRVETIKLRVGEEFKSLRAFNQEDIAQNAEEMLSLQKMFFNMIGNSAIVTTIMIITIVVLVAVMEQRKDIGTLRALGARKWRILSLVVGQSILLGALGGVVALPLSMITGSALDFGIYSSLAEHLSMWLRIAGMCIGVGVLASLLPAWQALRVEPMEALQFE